MNQFKNGTLLIVIATVLTAVLILTTGRDTSSTLQSQDSHSVNDNTTSTHKASAAETLISSVEVESDIKDESKQAQKEQTSLAINKKIDAPEGPFRKTKATLEDKQIDNGKKINKQAAYIQPTIVIATTINEETTKPKKQAIWMEQKLGDFMSIEKRDAVFKIMPTTPNGLQGEDPSHVITSTSDKFAPNTLLGNYNYQQMPMYNGGYYIAPMPSYFMPSMLPGKPTNKD